jgi:hypothetical protein
MIFGRIEPVLSMVTQNSLFNPTPQFITGSYITAMATPYPLGAHKVNFRVSYGNCEFTDGQVTNFKIVHQDNVTLEGQDIETWGTDDSVILDIIATKQGTTVVEVVSGEENNFGF